MDIKSYDDVVLKKEDDTVVLVNTFSQVRMKRETFRKIVAAHAKDVMRGNGENVTTHHETGTYAEAY